MWRAWQRL
jgi:hypothetical protein